MSSGSDGSAMRPGVEVVPPPLSSRIGLARPAWGRRGRYVGGVVGLAGAYYAAAKVGYELEFAGPVAAIVWLPAGVAISFLCLGGLRFWPAVLVGDLLANDYSALPVGSAFGQTAGNMVEVLVAALLIRRLAARGSPLNSLAGLGRLLAAIAAATAISATIGPLSLLVGRVITTDALPEVARTWWLGDAAGALVVIPLALAWYQPPPRVWARGRACEAVAMLTAGAGVRGDAVCSERPPGYLLFPAPGWGRPRLRRPGAPPALPPAGRVAG